jgi:hypothetical protein
MHKAPYRTSRRPRRTARTACFTVVGAYVLHERRRQPHKTYGTRRRGRKNEYGLTRKQFG